MADFLSKEQIAKKYNLPERQSKIAFMMKQEEHGLEEQVYCICRTSESNRFMIGCDKCEEWYHGDCIDITEKESRFIKKFYCPVCRSKDPSLTIRYKQKKLEKASKEESRKPSKKAETKFPSCGSCLGCYRTENCGKCEACRARSGQQCKYRVCLNYAPQRKTSDTSTADENEEAEDVPRKVFKESNFSDEDVWQPAIKKEKPPATVTKPVKTSVKKEKSKARHATQRRKPHRSSSDEDRSSPQSPGPSHRVAKVTQCYGPQCCRPPRPNSKYCSDQCGINLAAARIYQILPQRLQEWSATPCVAEDHNKKELEQVRKQQLEAREALEELDRKHKDLDALIARAKQFTVNDSDDEADDGNEAEDSATVHCVTCGHGLTLRNAIRHMERCFNKYESQTSFGSIFQTRIEGNNMFCDFYNAANRTYCKRLKVLCPEHCKDPKISDTEVCGYPLVKDVFQETEEFCLAPKKQCYKHVSWEKLRRAEIDMERVRQWLKLDELFDRERQIRQTMAHRAGLLPLLLHSTFNHELMQQQPQQPEIKTDQRSVPVQMFTSRSVLVLQSHSTVYKICSEPNS